MGMLQSEMCKAEIFAVSQNNKGTRSGIECQPGTIPGPIIVHEIP